MIYANEWEPYPAAWLRNLAAAGEMPQIAAVVIRAFMDAENSIDKP